MKNYFSGAAARMLFPVLMAGTALATSACSKDAPPIVVQQDFSAADDATIQKYLADKNITNAKKQPSGVYYIPVITNPNGLPATVGRKISVLYTGMLLDGTVFDATSQRNNAPFIFTLGAGQVIAGWDDGIALMKMREKSILLIPSGKAYGGNPPPNSVIPANAVLRFEVEVTNIQ